MPERLKDCPDRISDVPKSAGTDGVKPKWPWSIHPIPKRS